MNFSTKNLKPRTCTILIVYNQTTNSMTCVTGCALAMNNILVISGQKGATRSYSGIDSQVHKLLNRVLPTFIYAILKLLYLLYQLYFSLFIYLLKCLALVRLLLCRPSIAAEVI